MTNNFFAFFQSIDFVLCIQLGKEDWLFSTVICMTLNIFKYKIEKEDIFYE